MRCIDAFDALVRQAVPLLGVNERKLEDLQLIALARERTKFAAISALLTRAVTTEHTIRPAFGRAEYFELLFVNPFTERTLFTASIADAELQIVTDADEWQYFATLHKTGCTVEDGVFTKEDNRVTFFLHPNERIFVPFKFQSFRAGGEAPGPVQAVAHLPIKGLDSGIAPRSIRVDILAGARTAAALLLAVVPQPPVVDRTLRFWQAERQFCRRTMDLPRGSSGAAVTTYCSNANVVCEAVVQRDARPCLRLKYLCGAAPEVACFLVAHYDDAVMASPASVWRVYVHAVQRVDETVHLGETAALQLSFLGAGLARSVQCFASDPRQLQVGKHARGRHAHVGRCGRRRRSTWCVGR